MRRKLFELQQKQKEKNEKKNLKPNKSFFFDINDNYGYLYINDSTIEKYLNIQFNLSDYYGLILNEEVEFDFIINGKLKSLEDIELEYGIDALDRKLTVSGSIIYINYEEMDNLKYMLEFNNENNFLTIHNYEEFTTMETSYVIQFIKVIKKEDYYLDLEELDLKEAKEFLCYDEDMYNKLKQKFNNVYILNYANTISTKVLNWINYVNDNKETVFKFIISDIILLKIDKDDYNINVENNSVYEYGIGKINLNGKNFNVYKSFRDRNTNYAYIITDSNYNNEQLGNCFENLFKYNYSFNIDGKITSNIEFCNNNTLTSENLFNCLKLNITEGVYFRLDGLNSLIKLGSYDDHLVLNNYKYDNITIVYNELSNRIEISYEQGEERFFVLYYNIGLLRFSFIGEPQQEYPDIIKFLGYKNNKFIPCFYTQIGIINDDNNTFTKFFNNGTPQKLSSYYNAYCFTNGINLNSNKIIIDKMDLNIIYNTIDFIIKTKGKLLFELTTTVSNNSYYYYISYLDDYTGLCTWVGDLINQPDIYFGIYHLNNLINEILSEKRYIINFLAYDDNNEENNSNEDDDIDEEDKNKLLTFAFDNKGTAYPFKENKNLTEIKDLLTDEIYESTNQF